ncbi:hypothetical protein Neosp_006851 [[Neocosmospora] mangrovei]
MAEDSRATAASPGHANNDAEVDAPPLEPPNDSEDEVQSLSKTDEGRRLEDNFDFQSIARVLGDAISDTWHKDCSYIPVAKPQKTLTITQQRKVQEQWKECGYPNGIFIAHKFKATVVSSGILADYLSFDGSRSLMSWIDICLPDTCRLAAQVAFERFDMTFVRECLRKDDDQV